MMTCLNTTLLPYWNSVSLSIYSINQHFYRTLSKQCAARLVKIYFFMDKWDPESCRQQFHRKINNCLLVDRASYTRRLHSSCPISIGCNKYWHVIQLCKSQQVYLNTVFLPLFYVISREHCIMYNRSYCSWRLRSKVTRVLWKHFKSSILCEKSAVVRSVLWSLFSGIIRCRVRKSSQTFEWFYKVT
jgi:hypothetical protein